MKQKHEQTLSLDNLPEPEKQFTADGFRILSETEIEEDQPKGRNRKVPQFDSSRSIE